MNRTEYKNDIEKHRKTANRKKESQKVLELAIEDLKKQHEKLYNDWRHENGLITMLEIALRKETDAKRKVTGHLKKYSQLNLEDESDHAKGERGTYLWMFCSLYGEDNEQDDPYYDFHYMDDWVECEKRCEVYIEAIEKKEISELSS